MSFEHARRITHALDRQIGKLSATQINKALDLWAAAINEELVKSRPNQRSEPSMDNNQRNQQNAQPQWGKSPLQEYFSTPYNASALSGHQLAALRAGLAPETPGLERMTFPQMQELARQQALQAIEPVRNAHARLYREGTKPPNSLY